MEANENASIENVGIENAMPVIVVTVTPESRMKTVAEDIQTASKTIETANKLITWAAVNGIKNITENMHDPGMTAGVAYNLDSLDNLLDRKQSELREAIKKLKSARENLNMVKLELPGIE